MTVCRRVYYSGRVQGVGFRYTAVRIAQDHAVQGFVKNLPDGRVELVAEGEPEEVDAFLDAVRRQFDGYIEGLTVQDEAAQGFRGFRVAH
jgi:acylphosphatase